jgi:hypothetical protein
MHVISLTQTIWPVCDTFVPFTTIFSLVNLADCGEDDNLEMEKFESSESLFRASWLPIISMGFLHHLEFFT